MLENGTVLEGKYEILKEIGRGGTSIVYLAMNQKLNQQWVIKEIDYERNPIDGRRVLKEARLMMRFDHPAIPRIVDILEESGAAYIIMDYISGQSLAYELQEKGPQPQEIVLEWAKQICNVLMYLHSQNPPIIYQDLKPGNIILKEPEKNLKLIDFGEARACINGNAPGAGYTKEYAAPEQLSGSRGKTDERTDIYCFGATFYRLLTGKFAPFPSEQAGSIREAFPERNVSKGMDNIIRKCMQPDPAQRFQSAEELKKALDNIQLWDRDYLKHLKRRIHLVVVPLGMSFVMALVGAAFYRGAALITAKDYENLIHTAQSLDYETRIEEYEKAIELDGKNPKAYIKLLEAYEDNGYFGKSESQQFSTLYNQNKSQFDHREESVIEMHYLAGRLYFNMYSGESTGIRSRVQKSQEYFSYVKEYGSLSYKHYRMASSYETLCEFFKTYVLNDSSVREPSAEDYREMLKALEACLKDMQDYSAKDAAFIRLSLYVHLLDMLNVNMKGLAVNGIEKKDVQNILHEIDSAAKSESVTQQISIKKQERLLLSIENVLDNLQREYESLERGK